MVTLFFLIYMTLGVIDACRFNNEFPDAHSSGAVLAMFFTPAVRLFGYIVNNFAMSVLFAMLIYMIVK